MDYWKLIILMLLATVANADLTGCPGENMQIKISIHNINVNNTDGANPLVDCVNCVCSGDIYAGGTLLAEGISLEYQNMNAYTLYLNPAIFKYKTHYTLNGHCSGMENAYGNFGLGINLIDCKNPSNPNDPGNLIDNLKPSAYFDGIAPILSGAGITDSPEEQKTNADGGIQAGYSLLKESQTTGATAGEYLRKLLQGIANPIQGMTDFFTTTVGTFFEWLFMTFFLLIVLIEIVILAICLQGDSNNIFGIITKFFTYNWLILNGFIAFMTTFITTTYQIGRILFSALIAIFTFINSLGTIKWILLGGIILALIMGGLLIIAEKIGLNALPFITQARQIISSMTGG